jgi:hypothetical protein
MIIRVRSCLVSLSGALALGAALLGLPLASGSDRAFAEDIATATCLVPDDLLAISVEAAEEFDVRCHIAGAETPAVTAEAAAAGQAEIEAPTVAVNEPAAETPTASEGQAIRVEITQTVTVAATGQATEGDDITGSITPASSEPAKTAEPEPTPPQPAE